MANDADALLTMLEQVDLFTGLGKRELRGVCDAGKIIDFAAGEELTEEGKQGGRFFLILEGTVTVLSHGRVRNLLGPGNYLGEISLIDGQPRSASVVADGAVRTWSLASFAFRPLLREHPEMAEQIMLLLCRRLRAAEAEATA